MSIIDEQISPSLIEQISEEPRLYWSAGLRVREEFYGTRSHRCNVSTSKDLAWATRCALVNHPGYIAYSDEPIERTKEETLAFARAEGYRVVGVRDETGIVEEWQVQP